MAPSSSAHSLTGAVARRCVFCVGLSSPWLACSVTLDPTLLPPSSSNDADVERPGNPADAQPAGMGDAFSRAPEASGPTDASFGPAVDGSGSADVEAPSTCVLLQQPPKEYFICTEPLNGDQAAADCKARGGSLVAIRSADENAFLYAQALIYANSNLWLGGRRDDAMLWTWPDGSAFWSGRYDGVAVGGSYTNWKSGEPNNSSTVTTEPEQCMVMTLTDGGWNDRARSLDLAYVCQRP